MIKKVLAMYFINSFSLFATANVVTGLVVSGGLPSLALVAIGFTLLHLAVRPLLATVFGPLNFLTFGLVGLFIDAVLLHLLTIYFPQVRIIGWTFPGFSLDGITISAFNLDRYMTTAAAALVINLVRSGLSLILT